jgi:hypothetical protein
MHRRCAVFGQCCSFVDMSDTIDQSFAVASLQKCSGSRRLIDLARIGFGQSYRFFGPGETGMSLMSQTSEFSHASIA